LFVRANRFIVRNSKFLISDFRFALSEIEGFKIQINPPNPLFKGGVISDSRFFFTNNEQQTTNNEQQTTNNEQRLSAINRQLSCLNSPSSLQFFSPSP